MNEKLKDTAYIDNLLEKYEYKRKLVEAISKMTLSEIYNEAEEMSSLTVEKIHYVEQNDEHNEALVKKMFLDLKLGNIN